jgi:hypothetical protein
LLLLLLLLRLFVVDRIVAPMSDTEKLLNKKLLDKVQQAGLDISASQQQQLQQHLNGGCVRTATAAKRTQQS